MPTNVFFNQAVASEQNLVEDLVVESLRMYGHNCYYLPRKVIDEDTILGDVSESSFEESYQLLDLYWKMLCQVFQTLSNKFCCSILFNI